MSTAIYWNNVTLYIYLSIVNYDCKYLSQILLSITKLFDIHDHIAHVESYGIKKK